MRIAFYINSANEEAVASVGSIASTARRCGLSEGTPRDADVLVALGGDGTILSAVRLHPSVPVLGLNLGSLGYLSSVGRGEFDKAFSLLSAGRFKVAERSMLQVGKAGGRRAAALNDVVVVREMSGHAAILDVAVNGKAATRYMSDGLVVATPTGSTAYSLASGGPVLMPDTSSFVLTAINPHALDVRPIVVNDSVTISVTSRRRVNGAAEKIGVWADGRRVFRLDVDESAAISKYRLSAKLVELEGYDPYEVLSRKLGWARRR